MHAEEAKKIKSHKMFPESISQANVSDPRYVALSPSSLLQNYNFVDNCAEVELSPLP